MSERTERTPAGEVARDRAEPTTSERPRPWVGEQAFERPQPTAVEQLVPTTGEERFWRRAFPWLFAPARRPSRLARVLHHVLVTPLAHVTFLNLHYQIYLYLILHTTPQAWIGHAICIPINVGLLFYALAVFSPFGAAAGFGVNGGLILLALLSVWYIAMAAKLKNVAWGVGSTLLVTALWAAGNGLALATVDPLAHPGWAPTAWFANPLFLIAVVSLLQASSHLFERHVPPRANFRDVWMTTRDFLWGDPRLPLGRRLRHLAWTPVGAIWGTADEWWASMKLLPIFLLQVMWALGYKPAQQSAYRKTAITALQSGNPALDWVGSGGGAFAEAVDTNDAKTR